MTNDPLNFENISRKCVGGAKLLSERKEGLKRAPLQIRPYMKVEQSDHALAVGHTGTSSGSRIRERESVPPKAMPVQVEREREPLSVLRPQVQHSPG